MNTESTVRSAAAKIKIYSISEIGKRIGVSRSALSRKLKKPTTLTIPEIQELAKLFNWTDAELGHFLRGIE